MPDKLQSWKKKLSILLTERHYYTLKATMNMKTLKISIANGNCAVKIILVITSGINFVIACVETTFESNCCGR